MLLPIHKKLLIITVSSCLILVLFTLVVILPLINKIKDLSQEYLTARQRYIQLSQGKSSIRDLEQDYQNNQKKLSKIEGAFLDSKEIIGFIYDLEEIAEQTNNIFEIEAFPLPIGEEETATMNFQISLWGSFSNSVHFLANLENTPYPPYRLIEIKNLNIRENTDSGENDIKTVLMVKVYTQ